VYKEICIILEML